MVVKRRQWFVHIPKELYYFIKGQPKGAYEAYLDAVSVVNEVKDLYSQHTIELCQHGFLVAVEGQKVALRCGLEQELKEIHITEIVEYEPEE